MTGHGEKLSRKGGLLIAALLSESTYEGAARKAGISLSTLHRWMNRPQFRSAYKSARKAVVDHAIGRLSTLTTDAIDALRRNLSCGQASSEVKAALGVLEHIRGFLGGEELETSVETLEAKVQSLENTKPTSTHPTLFNGTRFAR